MSTCQQDSRGERQCECLEERIKRRVTLKLKELDKSLEANLSDTSMSQRSRSIIWLQGGRGPRFNADWDRLLEF